MSSSFVKLNRLRSLSKSLERINAHILHPRNPDSALLDVPQSTQHQKEMQTVLRLTSYNSRDFHHRWAIVILLVNLYNFFTAAYFLGTPGFPQSIWLGLELFSELTLLVDLAGRFLFRNSKNWERM